MLFSALMIPRSMESDASEWRYLGGVVCDRIYARGLVMDVAFGNAAVGGVA